MSLRYRLATLEDVEIFFHLANDPDVRANAINKGPISFDTHSIWFKKKIEDPNSKLYLFEINNQVIGQVRLDLENDHWLIDYAVSKEFRNKGLGFQMLAEICKDETITFHAWVQENNIASIRVFEKLNFKEIDQKIIQQNRYFIYEKR